MPLAIFDLDETLIATDSDHEWGEYVCDNGLVDSEYHRRQNDAFYEDYKAGRLDVDNYLKFACAVLAAHDKSFLEQHRSSFFEERIKPRILEPARTLIESHRQKGDTLLVITSTIEFVTRPIVDALGIETLIAPVPEIVDGQYTGEIVGVPSFGEGKVTRLMAWLQDTGHAMSGAAFYSDSHNDLPLLERVDHPIAVDPDDTLRQHATARGWRIISLRA